MIEPTPLTVSVAALLVLGVPLLRLGLRRRRWNRLLAEAQQFVERVQQQRALSPVATGLALGPGEHAFYCAPSVFYETGLIRLEAKSPNPASASAHPPARRWGWRRPRWRQVRTRAVSGRLTVTNHRLVFEAPSERRTVPLERMAHVASGLKRVELGLQGERSRLVFTAANPVILAAIIRLCGQVDNPLDLADTTLRVTVVD